MDNAGYVTLSRQSGLLMELDVIANNIANMGTDGFRREGMLFSEYVDALPVAGGSLTIATPGARYTDALQGDLAKTDAPLDLAIEGQGYFMVESADGVNLTRAGSFVTNAAGELTTWRGQRVLDEGQAPIFIAPTARDVSIATDGTVSVDGEPQARIGVVSVEGDRTRRAGDNLFTPEGALAPANDYRVAQGFIEKSNVNPVVEIARLLEVHRAYEIGQTILDNEDQRIRDTVEAIGRSG